MHERVLGKDLRVSAVGLGCMGFSHAYGVPTEKSEAVKTLRDSLDLGYTFFDTVTYFYGHFCIIAYILLISSCKFFKNAPA